MAVRLAALPTHLQRKNLDNIAAEVFNPLQLSKSAILVLSSAHAKATDPPLSSRYPDPNPLSRPRYPALVDVVHRACGGCGTRPSWRVTTTDGMAPVEEPPTARLARPPGWRLLWPTQTHLGSFIPRLRNGPFGPKGFYPNQSKKKKVELGFWCSLFLSHSRPLYYV